MATDLPTLVGQWNITQEEVLVPAVGREIILQPDPTRLAFGVAMNNVVGVIQLAFINTIGLVPGIYIAQLGHEWFYWGKHSSFVAQGFEVIQASGGPNKITVYNVTQAQRQ